MASRNVPDYRLEDDTDTSPPADVDLQFSLMNLYTFC